MKRLCLCLALCLCAVPAHAQIVGQYQWKDMDDAQSALLQWTGAGWAQVGGWSYEGDYYRPLVAGEWGAKCEPPIPPLVGRYVPRKRNFGMDYHPRRKQTETKYTDQDGVERSRSEVIDAIKGKPMRRPQEAEAPVPDDSQKLKATVIDQDAARRERLAGALRQTGAAVQAYDPTGPDVLAWAVKRYGYLLESPQVYLQDPSGKVLSRTPREATGPELLTAAAKAEAMRVKNPQYDASKDQDLTQPSPLAIAGLTPTDTLAGGSSIAAILAAVLFRRKAGV